MTKTTNTTKGPRMTLSQAYAEFTEPEVWGYKSLLRRTFKLDRPVFRRLLSAALRDDHAQIVTLTPHVIEAVWPWTKNVVSCTACRDSIRVADIFDHDEHCTGTADLSGPGWTGYCPVLSALEVHFGLENCLPADLVETSEAPKDMRSQLEWEFSTVRGREIEYLIPVADRMTLYLVGYFQRAPAGAYTGLRGQVALRLAFSDASLGHFLSRNHHRCEGPLRDLWHATLEQILTWTPRFSSEMMQLVLEVLQPEHSGIAVGLADWCERQLVGQAV